MKRLIAIILTTLFILPFPAFAEIKTITHTVQQPFGGSQSPDDARIAGIARAKREALEQFGTYIESTTIVKNSQVDSDEILALTAGVAKAEVIKQKNYTDGDAFGIEITVKVELDTAVLENSLKRLLEDRSHLKDLKAAHEREKVLLAQIAELQKENQLKGMTTKQSATLKKEFLITSQWLAAVEWFSKAIALWDGGKFFNPEKSIEYLTQAIRLDPDFAPSYLPRGMAYDDLKQFDNAIADYDHAILLNPNDVAAYFSRGRAYFFNFKHYEHAIQDFNQAIRLDPKLTRAYGLRGIAYFALKQYERAIQDFDQVIRLDPNFVTAFLYRGRSNYSLGQYNIAISDYDQAIRLSPSDASAYNNRGVAYLASNQARNGCADLEKACTLGDCNQYELAQQANLCR